MLFIIYKNTFFYFELCLAYIIFVTLKLHKMITTFYITNILLLLSILFIVIFMYGKAKQLKVPHFQLRRRTFLSIYIMFAIYILSTFKICYENDIEIFATIPICLIYITFILFSLSSTAYFGHDYHKKKIVWIFLIQYPLVILLIHAFVVIYGYDVKLYTLSGMLQNKKLLFEIFISKIEWLIIIIPGYLIMIGMIIDSYHHYRKNITQFTTEKMLSMRHDEIKDIVIYLILFSLIMLSNFIPTPLPRILTNILITIMIARTYIIYNNFINISLKLPQINIIIPEKLEKMMGLYFENPFYTSNPTLEVVSEALNVDKEELRNYIYSELGTTLSAWTSEKRILYISQQLIMTDRMVGELALSCGYSNPSALNRAFKQHFGVTPSEFRAKHKS